MKKVNLLLVAVLCIVQLSFADETVNHFKVEMEDGVAQFYKNGEPFFVQGVGGENQLDRAASYGANAFRTWDANVTTTRGQLDVAKANGMYLMMGIWLSQRNSDYNNENYKNQQRNKIRQLLDAFKDDPHLMVWALGNETNLNADTQRAWEFINELAGIIKEQDTNHPVATVISHSPGAINNIAQYCPNIDIIGFNTYGGISGMKSVFNNSQYEGAYMVTEWGSQGHWENGNTSWNAPIEPTSEEKRRQYETRYTDFILNNDRCVGSFVFLWGQKQERTPTWCSMFVESNVAGLPINGEACPTVETMEKLWTGTEPKERAPIVEGITMNGKPVRQTEVFKSGSVVKAVANASDPRGYELTYHWEILKEATQLGTGGSYEPRPNRMGEVVTGNSNEQDITVPNVVGNYRLFVYVLNGRGMVGTSNIPFQVGSVSAIQTAVIEQLFTIAQGVDMIQVQSENEVVSIQLFTIGGQLVVNSDTDMIDTSVLAEGIYVLKVQDITGNIGTFKIVVK